MSQLKKLTKSVVYLKGEEPKIESIKGEKCEIGFRKLGAKKI